MSRCPKCHIQFRIASACIAAAALFLPVFTATAKDTNSSLPDYAMYKKGDELRYIDFSKDSSGQISTGLFDELTFDYSYFSEEDIIHKYTLSPDGELLFFPDTPDYPYFSLFCRDIDSPRNKAVKIDSNVHSYLINEDASAVIYQKDHALCRYDRKSGKRQTIADNAGYHYYISDDGNTILYSTNDGIFYYTLPDGRREKADINVYDMNCISGDLSTIYYISSDLHYSLYKKERGKEEVIINYSALWKVIKAYDSGELYYVTVDTVDFPLLSYVYDEKRESDAALTKPVAPARNSTDYATAYRAYRKACKEYSAKLKRDKIRAFLEKEKYVTYCFSHYALYYYDGKHSTLISNSFKDSSYAFAADKPVITYSEYNLLDNAGVDLSEIEDADHVIRTVSDSLCSIDRRIAFGASSVSLDREEGDGTDFCLSADGNTLYYLEETPKKDNCGNLYQMDISSPEKPGTPKLYDTDVVCGELYYVGRKNLLYFKNYEDGSGELYLNRKKMDDDVTCIIPADPFSAPFLYR